MNFGGRKALAGVVGHVTSVFMLALASVVGVSALLVSSELLFTIVKYIGVGYLAYIGVAIWKSKGNWAISTDYQDMPSSLSLFRKSFVLGITNPKGLVFFTALFPQFIQPDAPLLPQFALLAGTSLTNAFLFTSAYALLGCKFKRRLTPLISKGWISKITGSLFLSFASALALMK